RKRLLFLQLHNVLLMPLGLSVAYAVHSPRPAVISSRMLWNIVSVPQTLQLLFDVEQR
ncbi:hypothetical protein CERZMDRAFT_49577, partial [Cercospora zeae-maydis SCOH1-5]